MIKNVLKEDFYRLKRSKAFWICFGIAAVLSLLAIMFLNMAFELVGSIVFEGSVSELLSPEFMAAISFLNVDVPVFCMILAGVLVSGASFRMGRFVRFWLPARDASEFIFQSGSRFSSLPPQYLAYRLLSLICRDLFSGSPIRIMSGYCLPISAWNCCLSRAFRRFTWRWRLCSGQ